tara:strand:+ start:42 stop:308 length:267 start_codon:yes stop_codon:yes gene_type:complete
MSNNFNSELITTENEIKQHRAACFRSIQEAVGGWVETLYLGHDHVMLINEEGVLLGAPVNATASIIAGTAIYGNVILMNISAFDALEY